MVHKFSNPDFNTLVEDTSFIRWVRSDFQTDDGFWSEVIDNNPEAIDEINKAIHFVSAMSVEGVSQYLDKEKLWRRIAETTAVTVPEKTEARHGFNIRSLMIWASATAAIFLVFYIFRPSADGNVRFINDQKELMTLQLPDKSEAILNLASSIRYDDKAKRVFNLDGEAYFKVVKGDKFKVHTELGEVIVLGTEFNVFVRDKRMEVRCYEGKVSVRFSKDDLSHTLTAGMSVEWDNGKVKTGNFDIGTSNPDWRNGVFHYDSRLFKEVADEFSRQFDLKVTYPEHIGETLYSGFFQKADLEKAIESIAWPMGLEYRIEGNTVILTEKKK